MICDRSQIAGREEEFKAISLKNSETLAKQSIRIYWIVKHKAEDLEVSCLGVRTDNKSACTCRSMVILPFSFGAGVRMVLLLTFLQ